MIQPEKPLETSSPETLAARRIDAARNLLKPHHIRDSLALAKQLSLRNAALAGLQAAMTVAMALPLVYLSPWPYLMGFASLGALVALFGRFAAQNSRNRIVFLCGLCQTCAVLVMSAASWLGAPETIKFILLALACGIFPLVSTTGKFGPPGALIFVFAAGASMGPVGAWQEIVGRVIATGATAALALAICALTEAFRHPETAERQFPTEPQRSINHRLLAAARIAFGSAIAIFASNAAGAAHPAWAAMGAVAVMQGAHLHITMNRALQRMAGTTVGALVVWLILIQTPSVWTIIAILVVLQFATEIIIGANYALGQILVTPMALLMSHLAAPHTAGVAMAPERILDTLLGVCIGIVIAVLCSTLDDRLYLARHHAEKTSDLK